MQGMVMELINVAQLRNRDMRSDIGLIVSDRPNGANLLEGICATDCA